MSADREQAIRESYEQSEGLDVSCEDIGFLLDALAQLRAERDTLRGAVAIVRQLCQEGHGDDLIGEVSDAALASVPDEETQA